ncbi:MAG: hypothetical protein LUD74_04000 [Tannerellaceae bacterium]|nr:hypothetical protein [Bacteroides sp.]MCD8193708.1 hypothetical protein [Tannerellaceae bacterium]
MAQNTLTHNVKTATEVIKEVKEAIIEKGVEIPEGTHATQYPGYIAKMTSQTELEEFKEQVVLKGINESEVKVSAPTIELNATEDSASGLSLEDGNVNLSGKDLKTSLTGDILLETSEGNINLNPITGEAQYKGVEIATEEDISGISNEVTVLEGRVNSIDSRTVQNETDIITLQTGLDTADETISALDGRITTLETFSTDLGERLSTAETRIVTNIEDIVSNTENIEVNTGNIQTLTGKVTTLEEKILSNTGDIETNTTNLTDLTGRVTTAEGNITDLTDTVNNISSSLQDYLPLSGGTITGQLNMEGESAITFNGIDAAIGMNSNNDLTLAATVDDANIVVMPGSGGKFLYGFDEIATVNDIPDVSAYLPLTGGTLTGNLVMDDLAYIKTPGISLGEENVGIVLLNDSILIINRGIEDGRVDIDSEIFTHNGNTVATIATFDTDIAAEVYSKNHPTVLVISTQQ